ncbi:MAG: formylmethanofuran dehydrogenase subunit B [Isosphaeraceae bacterium]|nr:formylmethanofuran dehydrogenase subunit B [Isosphaeraceae bacterium]
MSIEDRGPDEPDGSARAVVADATCLACGCLCDDIVLTVAGGRIIAAENACEAGRAWFLGDHGRGDRPVAAIQGRPVAAEEAIDRAAAILSRARAPIILGLTRTTIEAQAAAVAIADRLGAAIDPGHSADAIRRILAIQRIGQVSAMLGEVRNRADVVVFWGVDPITTHPRHWERYSVEPVGRFVPEGRRGRTVLVADAHRTATAERADGFLPIEPDRQFEVLWTLRALVKGVPLDPERVRRATGFEIGPLRDWADRLARARYGAFFFGAELGRARGGSASVEAALALVRDLNAISRFVALTLGGPGNPSGAEAVLTWQAGAPLAVDFGRGYPRFLPVEANATILLARGQVDAALILADDPAPGRLSPAAQEHLRRIPTVVIAPDATTRPATVALSSATPGIHTAGTVIRSDGVSLPLRPALAIDLPTDREWLDMIRGRLKTPGGRT